MAPPANEALIEEFVVEAQEHLAAIAPDLLGLEAQDSSCSEDTINRIFRAMHSIKGRAGLLGFDRINRLSHAMEALLMRFRDGELTPDAMMVDILLAGVDGLRAMLGDIWNSNEFPCEDLIGLFESFLGLVPSPGPYNAPPALPYFSPFASAETEAASFESGPGPAPDPAPVSVPQAAAQALPHPPVAHPQAIDTIRVRVDLLNSMMSLANELVLSRNQLLDVLENETLRPEGLRQVLQDLNLVTNSLQEQIMQARMQSGGRVLGKIPVPETEDRHQVLLFTFHPEEVFAMALADIARLEPVVFSEIQHIGDREFLGRQGAALPVIRLDHYLPVRSLPNDKEEGYLIIPKGDGPRTGLLASDILDTVHIDFLPDRESYPVSGMGTAVVNDKVTIFLELAELLAAGSGDVDLAWEAYPDG